MSRRTRAQRHDALAGTVILALYGIMLGVILTGLAVAGWLWGAR